MRIKKKKIPHLHKQATYMLKLLKSYDDFKNNKNKFKKNHRSVNQSATDLTGLFLMYTFINSILTIKI